MFVWISFLIFLWARPRWPLCTKPCNITASGVGCDGGIRREQPTFQRAAAKPLCPLAPHEANAYKQHPPTARTRGADPTPRAARQPVAPQILPAALLRDSHPRRFVAVGRLQPHLPPVFPTLQTRRVGRGVVPVSQQVAPPLKG